MTLDNKQDFNPNKPLLITASIVIFTVFFNLAMTITTSVYAFNMTTSIVSAFAG
jgi:hypothetical protein